MSTRRSLASAAVGALVLLGTPGLAGAERQCTLLVDAATGRDLTRQGTLCDERTSPASSFKVPLAVMGFDSGILIDGTHPVWPYLEEYAARRPTWRQPIDPTLWLRESVVWYSQKLTRTLGMTRFRQYVDGFAYGNRDLAGDAGAGNGLTNAWLSSSLLITPVEQAAFIRKLLRDELPASAAAHAMTRATVATYPVQGRSWVVHGKTGTGSQVGHDGRLDDSRQFGWFVGWMTDGARRLIFVRLIKDDRAIEESAGFRARDTLLADLPGLAGQD